MLPVVVQNNRVHVGDRFSVSLQRTDRVAELTQPPVSRGQLPVRQLSTELLRSFRLDVRAGPIVVGPCDEQEAVWLGFSGENSRRVVLKIGQRQVNAVSGTEWDESLHEPQDYLVTPDQTCWYGIRTSDGRTRQFSRDPIEVVLYEPRQADDRPARKASWAQEFYGLDQNAEQREPTSFPIVPDPKGIEHWSVAPSGRVSIYFVDSELWKALTGDALAPPSESYQ